MDRRRVNRFRKFPIYQKLRKFRQKIRVCLNSLPNTEERRLVDQVMRAINSSCLNIAEGANKPTDREFAQFVNRSLISVEEVGSVLDMCLDDGYITDSQYLELLTQLKEIAEDLLKFERSLRKVIV